MDYHKDLIATSAIASGLAISRALKKFSIPGTVTVLGTPAEEAGGGKITMIRNGAYKDVDACIMTHPSNYSQIYLSTIAGLTNVDVVFHGRKAHAGIAPWDGVNSLDAITLMWQAVGLLRQQLMPTDRISGVIVDGGAANNVNSPVLPCLLWTAT
jgi:metal-dependent amidase/aminoacylase/carboxypeptidase family protein